MGCKGSKTSDAAHQETGRGLQAQNAQQASPAPSNSTLPPRCQAYVLCSVYDGDTIRVRRPEDPKGRDHEVRVRFLGIDTPELKEQEPFAQEAKNHLLSVLVGSTIAPRGEIGTTIYIEPPCEGNAVDRYDRMLGVVYALQGDRRFLCVNESLVQHGLARIYEPTPNQLRDDTHKALQEAQLDARRHKRNIWSLVDESATVYTTTNGKAYHASDCEHLHGGGRPCTVGKALDRGLAECRTCHAHH